MGWKTVVIGTECTVSLTLNRMKITIGNEYQNIPLCDLDTVIFSHDRITMTIPMLSKLVENNINVIICDSKNDPIGIFQPFNNHSLVFKQLNKQINWKITRKKKLWKFIIEQKIQSEIDVRWRASSPKGTPEALPGENLQKDNTAMLVTIRPSPGGIGGVIAAPPSKSMAHRAVLCAALAVGRSHITHLEFSKDISATLSAAAQLCAAVDIGADDATVQGLGHFLPLTAPVDCCESGSTLRFLIPIASLTGQPVTFTGRGRLMERPQSVYEALYREQNLRFEQSPAGLTVEGALTPGDYRLAGNVSSQFISGLLFALPLLPGDSQLHLIPPVESRSYIDMTRAVQATFGVHSRWLDETTLLLPGGQQYHPCDYNVEGDYSQAAFPAVLGAVCGGVTITGLAPDTLQGDAAILDILRRCGAVFTRTGDSVTFAKAPLHGVDIDLADCPDLGPVLMVLGLLCEGTTVIRNAERLRLKESDRIAAMEAELRACGGVLESDGGTITVHGCAERLHAPAAPLHGHNDHRVVMSLAVLAAAAGLPLTVDDAEAIQKSWPGFFADAAPLGVEVEDA